MIDNNWQTMHTLDIAFCFITKFTAANGAALLFPEDEGSCSGGFGLEDFFFFGSCTSDACPSSSSERI